MNRQQRRLEKKGEKKKGVLDAATQVEVDGILNLGHQNHQAGMLDDAQTLYKKVLSLDPNNTEANHLLGVVAHHTGNLETGIELISKAVRSHPAHFAALNNLGNAQAQAGLPADAEKSYRKALKFKPDYAMAHGNLGKVLMDAGRLGDAIKHLSRAIQLEAANPAHHINHGAACMATGLVEEAEASFRSALELTPADYSVHNELGILLQADGRLDGAEACYKRTIEINETSVEAHVNMGNLMEDCLRFEDSKGNFHHAIELEPGNVDAHRNLGMVLLRQGDFENGFAEYAWRVSAHARDEESQFQGKVWDGGGESGRRILIHAEQGLGDTIQFARYLPVLEGMGYEVVFECQPPLVDLMASLPGEFQIIGKGDTLPDFDIHAPLLSLPGLLKGTLETIPSGESYLSATEDLVDQWKERLSGGERKKVGLVWRGRGEHNNDKNRSASLALFVEHLSDVDADFYCLQKDLTNEEQKMPVGFQNIGKDFKDFSDTAAALKNLDLVISVDTSVAHLAGALGVPTWLLLPTPPDWRWLMDRDDTPWYPSMRLFRKQGLEDWDGVLGKVAAELKNI
jgi:tetratricopeptide (TPR) repeat protein